MEFGRRSKHSSIQWLVSVFLILALIAGYIAAMYVIRDVSRIDRDTSANDRDTAYAILHLGFLTGATMIGFGIGKWLNGLGVAYATLFALALSIGMVAVQLSSYELACQGHNDLVRHWQC